MARRQIIPTQLLALNKTRQPQTAKPMLAHIFNRAGLVQPKDRSRQRVIYPYSLGGDRDTHYFQISPEFSSIQSPFQ